MTPRQRKQKRSLFLRKSWWDSAIAIEQLTKGERRVHPFSRRTSRRKCGRLLERTFGC